MENQEFPVHIPKRHLLLPALQLLGGAATMVGALVVLVEGLGNVDSIGRLFGFSGVLALSAIFGLVLAARREHQRTARLLLSLHVALIPVFWSQLAAIVNNAFYRDNSFAELIPGVSTATAAIIGGVGIAGLLTIFAIPILRILTPKYQTVFAGLLSLCGLFMCVPYRTGMIAGFVVLTVAAIIHGAERGIFLRDPYLNTPEARWVRATLIAMPLVVCGRAIHYEFAGLQFCACMVFAATIVSYLGALFKHAADATSSCIVDLMVAFGLLGLAHQCYGTLPQSMSDLFMYGVPALYLLLIGDGLRSTQGKFGLATLAIGSIACMETPSVVSNLASLIFPMLAAIVAVQSRSGLLMLISGACLLIGCHEFVHNLYLMLYPYRWSVLMVGGIGLIFVAPFIEAAIARAREFWSRGRIVAEREIRNA